MGDEEDRARMEQMTEKEREQEIFNRLEKREAARTRCAEEGGCQSGVCVCVLLM